ncbi:MAG: FtsX-like permease family protein [Campylobacterota bacterium]|nr:FtsX-like permease family protein [Campylobacterota bacterium]
MFELALKNLLYYRGRSITTLLLTFFSAYFFIVYVAFMDGSHSSMLKNALEVYTGSMQIYQKDYRDEGGYDYLIEDNQNIFEIFHGIDGLKAYSSRLETYGICSSKERSAAIMLTGVDFEKETKLSELKKALKEGVYDSRGACLYMGSDLAKKLQLKIGDEVSFVGSAIDYSFVAELFQVCGLFKTGMYDFDAQSAFMNRAYFDQIFFSQNSSSYIVSMASTMSDNDHISEQISRLLPKDMRLYSWEELMKSMVELMKIDSIFGYVSMGLFFLVIFFVIMIYGFINVSARIKEFGILKSIGLSDNNIDRLLLYEIMILTLAALALAIPLGAYTAYYFEISPIVIPGMSDLYREYGVISDEVPTLFDPWTVAWNAALVFLLNLLSILYPMAYVRSYTPIEAMHHV